MRRNWPVEAEGDTSSQVTGVPPPPPPHTPRQGGLGPRRPTGLGNAPLVLVTVNRVWLVLQCNSLAHLSVPLPPTTWLPSALFSSSSGPCLPLCLFPLSPPRPPSLRLRRQLSPQATPLPASFLPTIWMDARKSAGNLQEM